MAEKMTNFRAEDMLGRTKVSYAKKKGAAKPAAEPEVDPNAVPEGTAAEVVEWVGDDLDRAQRALTAESAAEKPRVTLTNDLEKLLTYSEPEADDEPEDDADKE